VGPSVATPLGACHLGTVKINMACSGADSSQALSQQPRRLFPPGEVNYYCTQVNMFLDGLSRGLCFI